jgi:hypothetical protein
LAPVTTSVDDLVSSALTQDNRETFKALWQITGALFEKVKARFDLTLDPCTADLQAYCGKDGASGSLSAYCGPQIDWLIHAWTGNPVAGFTNMHLTIYLGPHIDVPHFGFALGTIPDIFWYMDTIARKELSTNPDYADRYWSGEANTAFMSQMASDGFQPFISRDVYTRAALSPNAFCFTAPISPHVLTCIETASHAALDRWLGWVDAADRVPESEQAALAARDVFIRKTICQRDPANVIAERLFGPQLTERLVATLWGGTRTLPGQN